MATANCCPPVGALGLQVPGSSLSLLCTARFMGMQISHVYEARVRVADVEGACSRQLESRRPGSAFATAHNSDPSRYIT